MAGTQGSSYSSPSAAKAANTSITKSLKAGQNASGSSKTAANYGTGGNASANAAAAAAARAAAASAMGRGSDSSGSGNAASRANAAGSMTLGRMVGGGGAISGRTAPSSPMGAAMSGFGGQGLGGSLSGLQATPHYQSSMAFRSPFAGNGIAGDPTANRQPVIGQVNPSDLNMPQAQNPVEQRSANLATVASPSIPLSSQAARMAAVSRGAGTLGQMQGFGNGRLFAGSGTVMGIPGASLGNEISNALQRDYGMTPAAANGFAGNLAMETDGFSKMQEVKPLVPGSKGGYGWAQWTGPRRVAFEKYATENNLPVNSAAANYGYLKEELNGNVPDLNYSGVVDKLKGVNDVNRAAEIVMNSYEQPGIKNFASRKAHANRIAESGATGLLGSAPSTMVASAEQANPGMLTSRVVNGKLENYYEPAPGATVTPAAGPPTQTAGAPSFWEKIQNGVASGIETAKTGYNDYATKYASMPGSDAQKAAAIKGYAENGLLGGAWGYLTGGGIKPGTSANVDDPSKPNYVGGNRGGDNRRVADNGGVSEQQLAALNTAQRAEYDRLIAAGISPADALAAALRFTTGTGTGTGGGNNSLRYPNYYSQWAGLPSGQTYG